MYRDLIPEKGRIGVQNVFFNLAAPIRAANCLLQGKGSGFVDEVVRWVINSTAGLGGFLDVARDELAIPSHEEDLGQTLGFYGIKSGFYINWPILGPSNLRDSVGRGGDIFLDPVYYTGLEIWQSITLKAYDQVNHTSLSIGEYESLKEAALDPYLSMRAAYHQYRQGKIEQ